MAGRMSGDESTNDEWVLLVLHMSYTSLFYHRFSLFLFEDKNSCCNRMNPCLRSFSPESFLKFTLPCFCWLIFSLTSLLSSVFCMMSCFLTKFPFVFFFSFFFLVPGLMLVAFTFPKSRVTARPSFWRRWWRNTEESWNARSNPSRLGSAVVPPTRWSPFRIPSMIILHLNK